MDESTDGLERTPWFSGLSQYPRRKGRYEVRNDPDMHIAVPQRWKLEGSVFRFWTGYKWIPYEGATYKTIFGVHESHQWRGLVDDPAQSIAAGE